MGTIHSLRTVDSETTKQRSDPLSPFFLFIGSTAAESATSSLKAAKTRYQQKRLESGPENWKQIISLIRDPDLIGVVGKFTSQNFSLFVSGEYHELAESLLKHLKETQHVIFVHEAVLAGRPAWDGPVPEPEDESYIDYLVASGHFDPPPDAVREQVLQWCRGTR